MLTRMQGFGASLAILIQLATFTGLANTVFYDPLYMCITLIGCTIVTAWFCYDSWFDRAEYESRTLDQTGKKITCLKFNQSRTTRIIATLLFFGSVFMFAVYAMKERTTVFDIVEAGQVSVLDGPVITLVDNRQFPIRRSLNP